MGVRVMDKLSLMHLEGLPIKGDSVFCDITIQDESLKITETSGIFKKKAKNTFSLDLNKIISMDIINEKNIQEKQKSIVGRGIAGAVLFGPAGAIVGGLSGTGKKQKVKTKNVFVISYYGKDNEVKSINFDPGLVIAFVEEFIRDYEDKCGKNQQVNERGEIEL